MVQAVIERNLNLFRSRAVVSADPTGTWEYRIADFREREDYAMLTEWTALDSTVTFHTSKTFFGRMTFVPTAPAEGQTAFLELCTARGCEAFVRVNGAYYAGVNNDQGRNRVYLPAETYGSATEIEIELFRSNHASAEYNADPIPSCRWVIVDDEMQDFAHGMELLWKVIHTTKQEYTRDRLRALLERIIRESDQSLEGEEYRASIASLNAELKQSLADLGGCEDLGSIECVASTHIDVAWLWQYKDTIRKSGRSALNQFRIMDRYPEYEFSMSQPSVYNYIKEVYPDVFKELKKRVAEGSWRLVGPMWVESDLNLSGAETLIREFLYGHAFFKKEFGKSTEMCWIPDSFGFPANLPQLFAKCGMKYFYTTKVRWQAANDFPYNVFVWEGLDKSQLLATVPKTEGYYNGYIDPGQVQFASDHMQQKGLWDKTLFVYGFGDGGGGPTETMLDNYRKMQEYPGMPKVHLTRVEDYFGELEKKRADLPVWKGELCVETHQGTYTTISENKRSNRYAEMAYRRLDLLAAMAGCPGDSDEYEEIRKNLKDMLLMQFHDVLPGSSIDPVYEDTHRMYADVFAYADKKQAELLSKVFAPSGSVGAVTVFNPNSFAADAYVPVNSSYAGCALTNGIHTSNVLPDGKGGYVFFVKNLAGFTSSVYRKTAALPAESRVILTETDAGIAADTPFFTFTIAPDGTLRDFYDKREGVVYSEPQGLNRFVAYKDGPEREDAWNIDKEYKMRPVDLGWTDTVEISENNGERAVVRVTKNNGKTTLTQNITIYADIARVDFFSRIDWQEKYKILQVSFPTTIVSTQASYEIAYGVCKRGTHANTPAERWKHEYAAHRFIDLSDDRRGAALLNDCKYGHNVIDSDMIITLFRSTDYPAHFYDMGEHDFAYAFLPHGGGLSAGQVADQGYLFNSPLVVMDGEASSADVPAAMSDDGMILDCIKPAEDGNGMILRMYEPYGTSGRVTVTLPGEAVITETSPLEEAIAEPVRDTSFEVAYTPFDIRTFRIVK